MKNRIQLIIAIAVVSTFIAGSVLAADPGTCPAGQGREHFKEKRETVMRELGLTPEQDKLLKDAKTAHRAEMETLRKALKDKKEALRTALAKPGVTRQEVEPIASEIKALQSQTVDHRIDGILKIKTILTPEQFQKLQDKKGQWQKERKGRNEPRMRRFGTKS